MNHESGAKTNENHSILDTRGDEPVTLEYRGQSYTFTLRQWMSFCPIPHEEMDPAKIEEAAKAFLDGKNPFAE